MSINKWSVAIACLILSQAHAGGGKEQSSSGAEAPLLITTAELPDWLVGVEYFRHLSAEGGTPPYRWRLVGDLPPGLHLNKEDPAIGGKPEVEGDFQFSLEVTDREGASNRRDYSVRMIADPVASVGIKKTPPPPLAIRTDDLPEGKLGREYSEGLQAEGGVPPYLWQISMGSLPRGLTLDAAEGAIEGIPKMDGEYHFIITVRDKAGESAEAEYSILISTVRIYITTGQLPDATIGEDYYYSLDAVGGVLPCWWQIEAGSLPRGLSLDAREGVISGVPEESSTTWAEGVRRDIEPGLFRVSVTDGVGSQDRADFRISVAEKPEPSTEREVAPVSTPLIMGGSGSLVKRHDDNEASEEEEQEEEEEEDEEEEDEVVVVTDRLLPARIENEYSNSLEAAGGSPPYAWLIQGSLPEGLSLDTARGVLHGTPTETGTFVLRVQARDTLSRASEFKEVSLEVKDALQPVTGLLAAASDGKVGLAWVNPSDDDLEEVRIVRSPFGEPADSSDGEVAYNGDGDNTVDTGLEDGIKYYYAAFAIDAYGYESEAVESSRASAKPLEVTLTGECNPFADEVVSFNPLTPSGFGARCIPENVLGPPYYNFSAPALKCEEYVVSLHARENNDNGASAPYGGSITLRFSDNIVVNGEGPDFTVFGNGFYISLNPERMWIEPAVVEVSQDGSSYYRFPINYVEHGDTSNPYTYNAGFAGIWPAKSYAIANTVDPARSGGDQFDIDAIAEKNLNWISYVRLTATGDRWIVDMDGDPVRHTSEMEALSGDGKSGFDLDAVAAIHY